jgi:hypothetical protein
MAVLVGTIERGTALVCVDSNSCPFLLPSIQCGAILQGSRGIDWCLDIGAAHIDIASTLVPKISSIADVLSVLEQTSRSRRWWGRE